MIDQQRLDTCFETVDIGSTVARLDMNARFITATNARIDDRQDHLDVGLRGGAVTKRLKEDVERHRDSLPFCPSDGRMPWATAVMANANMTWVL